MRIPEVLMTGKPLVEQSSLGPPPPRRAGSVRRTTSLQASFPSGPDGPITFHARGRDIYTGLQRETQLIAEEHAYLEVTRERRLARFDANRPQAARQGLIGKRVSGELRREMLSSLQDDVASASLLYRFLDDLAGATFLSGAAWFSWYADDPSNFARFVGKLDRQVEGLCISYSPGSPSVREDGRSNEPIAVHPPGPLPFSADDPLAWHEFADVAGPNHWRIRFSDLWHEGDTLIALLGFQDSAARPAEADERTLFHEYRLRAEIDPATMELLDIDVTPVVLPYRTCLAAPSSARALIGQRLGQFSSTVPELLKGTAGCTHLNDVLRTMQDIEELAKILRGVR